MRGWSKLVALLLVLVSVGCAPWPTEQEIGDSLERSLRSVNGDWQGKSFGVNAITLDFRLHQDGNGKVSGTGVMQEPGAGSVSPFTVSGTYRRPVLALTFNGLQYQGEPVKGTLEGGYTSVGGISTTLQLTGANVSHAVAMLVHEE